MILFFIGDRYLFVQSREGVCKEEEEAGWNDDVRRRNVLMHTLSDAAAGSEDLHELMSFNLHVYRKLICRRRNWDFIQCVLNNFHHFQSVCNQNIKVVARRSLH